MRWSLVPQLRAPAANMVLITSTAMVSELCNSSPEATQAAKL